MTADDVCARLRPCPFCGGEAELVRGKDLHYGEVVHEQWTVSCLQADDEDCAGSRQPDYFTVDFAVEAWNRRAAHAYLSGEVRDSTGRSAKDYAIEHAGYMARAATGLIAAVNDLELARQQFDEGEGTEDATDEAEQSLGDAINALRSCIYEFEKRRDRALAKFHPTHQEKP